MIGITKQVCQLFAGFLKTLEGDALNEEISRGAGKNNQGAAERGTDHLGSEIAEHFRAEQKKMFAVDRFGLRRALGRLEPIA